MTGWGWGAIGQRLESDDNEVYAPASRQAARCSDMEIRSAYGSHKPHVEFDGLLAVEPFGTGNGSLLADTITPALSLWTTNKDGQWRAIPLREAKA